MSQLKNTRFGDIEYDANQLITFPKGLLGFEALRRFIVIPSKNDGPLFWIQSLEDPQVAFVVTDPTNFFPRYGVLPDDEERKVLGIDGKGEHFVLVIVSIREGGAVTLNLSAPILWAPTTNVALQAILDSPEYSTQEPLPTVEA